MWIECRSKNGKFYGDCWYGVAGLVRLVRLYDLLVVVSNVVHHLWQKEIEHILRIASESGKQTIFAMNQPAMSPPVFAFDRVMRLASLSPSRSPLISRSAFRFFFCTGVVLGVSKMDGTDFVLLDDVSSALGLSWTIEASLSFPFWSWFMWCGDAVSSADMPIKIDWRQLSKSSKPIKN